MKKLLIAIISIFLFTLTGCNISTKPSVNPTTTLPFSTTTINTTTITRSISSTSKTEKMVRLPDLTGMNREEISLTLDSLGISHIFGFDQSKYYGNSGYNKFVSYYEVLFVVKVYDSGTLSIQECSVIIAVAALFRLWFPVKNPLEPIV